MDVDLESVLDEENMVDSKVMEGGDGVNVNNAFSDNRTGIHSYIPHNGMEFETKEAAYSFYREYARFVGFGITIKASRRSKKSGKFIDIKIACSRFGNSRQSSTSISPRSCPKTDCKASMHIKKRAEGKWFTHSFVEDHNHEICPHDTIKGRKDHKANTISPKQGLQLVLDERDVQLLLDFFMHMQAKTPGFYHVLDFDKEARMRNIFWVDPKGRHDYVPFCDVVFFDTHYIRGKYKIPFVPVIGVNHHFQFILLGCALIGDQTASTYIWLMRTWLRAVSHHSPTVVITDNDKSLIEATLEVFPNASHCFCPWHVFNEVGTNFLSHKVSNRTEVFLMKFKKCIYRSGTNEEFEKRWQKMVNQFDLLDNKWIESLYENRGKWIPIFMRDVFLGGFCTAERSQSVASFFDKYLHKETTIEEFTNQYKIFLHERCEEEVNAEIENQPILISDSPFEKQMSKLYTNAVFKNFQAEASGAILCKVGKEDEGVYRVDDLERKQSFRVSWNKGKYYVCCLCRLFEYTGFLCRHALSVLQLLGISAIPPKYVLKRWTRKAKMIDATCQASVNKNLRVQRFNNICRLATKLGDNGSLSGEAYKIACHALEAAMKHCVDMNNSAKPVLEISKNAQKKKVRAEAETLSIGIQDSSQDVLNQRSVGLDDAYISEQDLQGMELGSRMPPITNGYYGPELQAVQGLGHLNSLPYLHDCYYSDQSLVVGNFNAVPACASHLQGLVFVIIANYGKNLSLNGYYMGQYCFRPSSMEGCFELKESLQKVEENSVTVTSKHLPD